MSKPIPKACPCCQSTSMIQQIKSLTLDCPKFKCMYCFVCWIDKTSILCKRCLNVIDTADIKVVYWKDGRNGWFQCHACGFYQTKDDVIVRKSSVILSNGSKSSLVDLETSP